MHLIDAYLRFLLSLTQKIHSFILQMKSSIIKMAIPMDYLSCERQCLWIICHVNDNAPKSLTFVFGNTPSTLLYLQSVKSITIDTAYK